MNEFYGSYGTEAPSKKKYVELISQQIYKNLLEGRR
jgi:hypothetical protein